MQEKQLSNSRFIGHSIWKSEYLWLNISKSKKLQYKLKAKQGSDVISSVTLNLQNGESSSSLFYSVFLDVIVKVRFFKILWITKQLSTPYSTNAYQTNIKI